MWSCDQTKSKSQTLRPHRSGGSSWFEKKCVLKSAQYPQDFSALPVSYAQDWQQHIKSWCKRMSIRIWGGPRQLVSGHFNPYWGLNMYVGKTNCSRWIQDGSFGWKKSDSIFISTGPAGFGVMPWRFWNLPQGKKSFWKYFQGQRGNLKHPCCKIHIV